MLLGFSKFDYIIELPCVAPIRDNFDIDRALKILFTNKYDSVISYVNTGEKHPTRLKRIKNNIVTNFCKEYPEPDIGSRRQDFEGILVENGAVYISSVEKILRSNCRVSGQIKTYEMNDNSFYEIDEENDFRVSEMLMKPNN